VIWFVFVATHYNSAIILIYVVKQRLVCTQGSALQSCSEWISIGKRLQECSGAPGDAEDITNPLRHLLSCMLSCTVRSREAYDACNLVSPMLVLQVTDQIVLHLLRAHAFCP
jgi:hypothetical protein